VRSDQRLVLTDDFPPTGSVEFDLDGRSLLRISFLPGEPVRSVEICRGFRSAAEIAVAALYGQVPVAQAIVSEGPDRLCRRRSRSMRSPRSRSAPVRPYWSACATSRSHRTRWGAGARLRSSHQFGQERSAWLASGVRSPCHLHQLSIETSRPEDRL